MTLVTIIYLYSIVCFSLLKDVFARTCHMMNDIYLASKTAPEVVAAFVQRELCEPNTNTVFFNGDNPHFVLSTVDKIHAHAKKRNYRIWIGYPTRRE